MSGTIKAEVVIAHERGKRKRFEIARGEEVILPNPYDFVTARGEGDNEGLGVDVETVMLRRVDQITVLKGRVSLEGREMKVRPEKSDITIQTEAVIGVKNSPNRKDGRRSGIISYRRIRSEFTE